MPPKSDRLQIIRRKTERSEVERSQDQIDDQPIKGVQEFTYLVSEICSQGGTDPTSYVA